MERSFSDAVVAVVGAAGGIGSRIARQLTDRGARLVLAGPHRERLRGLGIDDALCVELDLRDPRAGDAMAACASESFGRLDGLINAAGIVAFGPLTDTDDTVIEELFLTNVVGPLWLVKRLIPLLADSRGFVVNVSAVVAEQPMANMTTYSATKAALTAADRALARELRRFGIHVCDARPPHTETGLAQRPLAGAAPVLPTGLSPDLVAERILDAILAGSTEISSEGFSIDTPATRTGASRP
jgi:NAD(P)-dependent dehydrogenase (short-subunit alcohol dehydrogenase family)